MAAPSRMAEMPTPSARSGRGCHPMPASSAKAGHHRRGDVRGLWPLLNYMRGCSGSGDPLGPPGMTSHLMAAHRWPRAWRGASRSVALRGRLTVGSLRTGAGVSSVGPRPRGTVRSSVRSITLAPRGRRLEAASGRRPTASARRGAVQPLDRIGGPCRLARCRWGKVMLAGTGLLCGVHAVARFGSPRRIRSPMPGRMLSGQGAIVRLRRTGGRSPPRPTGRSPGRPRGP